MPSLPESVWNERRQILQQLEESGLPMAAFSREQNIPYYKLISWKQKLESQAISSSSSQPSFQEIEHPITLALPPASSQTKTIEVQFPDHMIVRIPPGIDIALLRSVLEVVRSCS